jgi:cysteine synthase A
VEELVGRTPLLEVPLPGPAGSTRLLAKLEMANPLGSVKDRAALYMMRAAEEAGLLPAAWAYAEELQRGVPGSWMPHQDRNPANVRAHYETTGPEIWEATRGRIDVLVCGVGTGGTLTGTARFLKERTSLHVVAVEPARSAVLSGGEAGPHGIPGIGAGYVSPITDLTLVDEVVAVPDDAASATAEEVTRVTGLPVGISSGAAAWASRAVAAQPGWAGATVVTVFPDSGERYLSTAR